MTSLSATPARTARLRTLAAALAAALPTFVIYLRTLYPGVVGTRDTAKFQFVGHVLGTPHNPGYPLFVLLSHVFSYVPIGTLAYRMNLFSAVLAAATVAVLTIVFIRLGVGRLAAVGLGIAAGLGQTFWSQAILAEVYALGALLLALTVLCLVEWRRTRRDGWLIGATAWAALALGNHLTIVMIAPAFLIFVALTDPRALTRPRLIVWAIVLTILGTSQYLFIMLRTYQGASYLESHARTIPELIGVMRAEQFETWVGAYSWPQIQQTRVPLFWRFMTDEFTIVGVALLMAGLVWGWRRDKPVVGLVVIGAAAILGFAISYAAPDIEVFLIPAFVLGWLAVAMTVARIGSRGRAGQALAIVATFGIAVALGIGNWRVNDHSRRTREGEMLQALFAALPDRSAIISDGPGLDWVLDYALLGEGIGARRGIRRLPQDDLQIAAVVKTGTPVYAFKHGREALADRSITFEPAVVPGPHLFDFLCGQQAGTWIAVAGLPAPWLGERERALACLGVWPDRRTFGTGPIAILGTVGGDAPAASATDPVRNDRPRVRAAAHDNVASLEAGGDAQTCADCVLYAVVAADGTVVDRGALDRASGLHVPFPGLEMWHVATVGACANAGNVGWIDGGDFAGARRIRLRVDNYRPFTSRVDLVVAGAGVHAARIAKAGGPDEARFISEVKAGLPDDLPPALVARARTSAAQEWLHFDVEDGGQFLVVDLDISGHVDAVFARATVDLNNPRRATVCDLSGSIR